MDITANSIYQADCLELLKRLNSGQVDLVYLDPPEGNAGTSSESTQGGQKASESEATLVEMLKEARRVVSGSGTVVFHQSPTLADDAKQGSETQLVDTLMAAANDRARLLLSEVFGVENFLAEFSWPGRRGVAGRRFLAGMNHTLLVYRKTPEQAASTSDSHFDEGGHYRLSVLTTDGIDHARRFAWKGFRPEISHQWKWTPEELDSLEASKRIELSGPDGFPMLKTATFEGKGVQVAPVWADIPPVSPSTREYTGWPSQRPLALLDRIVKLGSNPGDIVLDPFCGSGTALLSAQGSGRKWIGCEISPQGFETSVRRLERSLGLRRGRDFKVGNAEDLGK